MSLKIIESQRGKPLLVIGGYIFYLHKQTENRVYWRCTQCKTGCSARCITTSNNQSGQIIKEPGEHNHISDRGAIEAKTLNAELKNQAKTTKKSSSHLIESALKKVPRAAVPDCPTRASLVRMIRRVRNAENAQRNSSPKSSKQ